MPTVSPAAIWAFSGQPSAWAWSTSSKLRAESLEPGHRRGHRLLVSRVCDLASPRRGAATCRSRTGTWVSPPLEIGRQGQGLGTRMMRALCTDLDRAGQVAFLETDKPENPDEG